MLSLFFGLLFAEPVDEILPPRCCEIEIASIEHVDSLMRAWNAKQFEIVGGHTGQLTQSPLGWLVRSATKVGAQKRITFISYAGKLGDNDSMGAWGIVCETEPDSPLTAAFAAEKNKLERSNSKVSLRTLFVREKSVVASFASSAPLMMGVEPARARQRIAEEVIRRHRKRYADAGSQWFIRIPLEDNEILPESVQKMFSGHLAVLRQQLDSENDLSHDVRIWLIERGETLATLLAKETASIDFSFQVAVANGMSSVRIKIIPKPRTDFSRAIRALSSSNVTQWVDFDSPHGFEENLVFLTLDSSEWLPFESRQLMLRVDLKDQTQTQVKLAVGHRLANKIVVQHGSQWRTRVPRLVVNARAEDDKLVIESRGLEPVVIPPLKQLERYPQGILRARFDNQILKILKIPQLDATDEDRKYSEVRVSVTNGNIVIDCEFSRAASGSIFVISDVVPRLLLEWGNTFLQRRVAE